MRQLAWGLLLIVPFSMIACAEITPPTPQEILASPFGKGPLRLGMSKDEIRDIWGEPSSIDNEGQDQFGIIKEVWIYQGKYPGLVPVDVGYASKTKYLEFQGESLVNFHD
jgi:hypothetical protein